MEAVCSIIAANEWKELGYQQEKITINKISTGLINKVPDVEMVNPTTKPTTNPTTKSAVLVEPLQVNVGSTEEEEVPLSLNWE